jgi:hypothetical protein
MNVAKPAALMTPVRATQTKSQPDKKMNDFLSTVSIKKACSQSTRAQEGLAARFTGTIGSEQLT